MNVTQVDYAMLTQLIEDRTSPPTCVWMDVGLLTYRLCDRNFDCEHCPLDAALHGTPGIGTADQESVAVPVSNNAGFPRDRVYSSGHTWLLRTDSKEIRRFGVDSFAASLLPKPADVQFFVSPHVVHRQQPLCTIVFEYGSLVLASPVDARIVRWNDSLSASPSLILSDPYENGWFVELWPVHGNGGQATDLTDDVEQRARLDSRRFRRRVGQELLLEPLPMGGIRSNGYAATDLRRLIDPTRLIDLLREFIH